MYFITRFISSLKISASISLAAYNSRFLSGEQTTTQALMLVTLWQAFMQNSQPVRTTCVMPCTSSRFSSSFSGDFQQRCLWSGERQMNLGWGYLVLGECFRNRKPFFMWFSTQLIDSLSELSSERRFVGEERGVEEQEVLISEIAVDSTCRILEILVLGAFGFSQGDFILNIL